MKYILASSSPRRKDLMKFISSDFLIIPSNADETVDSSLLPLEVVTLLSFKKGQMIAKEYPNYMVISADTIVVIDEQIIGKPKDEEDAKRMLHLLSGRTHVVYTGYSLFYKGKVKQNVVESHVTFEELSDDLISKYVDSKSPLDKAGAYGLQDNNTYHIVKKINGSINNVIGFPVEEIKIDIEKMSELI